MRIIMFTFISDQAIKHIRESKKLTRKQVYSGICDAATYSRIENGTQNPSASMFVRLMERLGIDYRKLFINVQSIKDYEEFEDTEKISRLLRDMRYEEARVMLDAYITKYCDFIGSDIEKCMINRCDSRQKLRYQFALGSDAVLDIFVAKNLNTAERKLHQAITLTIPDFNASKIRENLLSNEEMVIINSMALVYAMNENYRKAIDIYYQLMNNIDTYYINDSEKTILYPMIIVNLTNTLGLIKRYDEAIELCDIGINYCREYNNLLLLPRIVYNKAYLMYYSGNRDDSLMLFYESYYCARAFGNIELANQIKKKATERFNDDF